MSSFFNKSLFKLKLSRIKEKIDKADGNNDKRLDTYKKRLNQLEQDIITSRIENTNNLLFDIARYKIKLNSIICRSQGIAQENTLWNLTPSSNTPYQRSFPNHDSESHIVDVDRLLRLQTEHSEFQDYNHYTISPAALERRRPSEVNSQKAIKLAADLLTPRIPDRQFERPGVHSSCVKNFRGNETVESVHISNCQDSNEEIVDLHSFFDNNEIENYPNKHSEEYFEIIKTKADYFKNAILDFSNSNCSIEYFVIHENLVKLIEIMDRIYCDKEDKLLGKKAKIIYYIQGLINQLETNATSN